MPSYVYKPGHPLANERGMVEKNEEYYMHEAMHSDDKGMMHGNERVRINYTSDHMEPLKHMALPYGSPPIDSKSKFRKITKERGCVEVGDQTHVLTKPRQRVMLDRGKRRDDIRRAMFELRNGQTKPLNE